jgi:hypothetical protein
MRAGLLAVVVLLSGCAKGGSLVVVTVESQAALSDVAVLAVHAELGTQSKDFNIAPNPNTIPPAQTFGIDVSPSMSGSFTVHVDAVDSNASVVASGDGQAMLAAGGRADIDIQLAGPSVDGGVPPDMAGIHDLATVVTIGQVTVADVSGTVYSDIGDGGEVAVSGNTHILAATAAFPVMASTDQLKEGVDFHDCTYNRYDLTTSAGAKPPADENAGDVTITGYQTSGLVGAAGTTPYSPVATQISCALGLGAMPTVFDCKFGDKAGSGPLTENVVFTQSGATEQVLITDSTAITETFTPAAMGTTFTDPKATTLSAPLPKPPYIISINGDATKHSLGNIVLSKTSPVTLTWSCDGTATAGGGCPTGVAGLTELVVLSVETALGPRNQSPANRMKFGTAQCVERLELQTYTFTLSAAGQALMLGTQTSGSARLALVHVRTSLPGLSGMHPMAFNAGRGQFNLINYP